MLAEPCAKIQGKIFINKTKVSSGEEAKEDEHIVVGRMGHWYKGESHVKIYHIFILLYS